MITFRTLDLFDSVFERCTVVVLETLQYKYHSGKLLQDTFCQGFWTENEKKKHFLIRQVSILPTNPSCSISGYQSSQSNNRTDKITEIVAPTCENSRQSSTLNVACRDHVDSLGSTDHTSFQVVFGFMYARFIFVCVVSICLLWFSRKCVLLDQSRLLFSKMGSHMWILPYVNNCIYSC